MVFTLSLVVGLAQNIHIGIKQHIFNLRLVTSQAGIKLPCYGFTMISVTENSGLLEKFEFKSIDNKPS